MEHFYFSILCPFLHQIFLFPSNPEGSLSIPFIPRSFSQGKISRSIKVFKTIGEKVQNAQVIRISNVSLG